MGTALVQVQRREQQLMADEQCDELPDAILIETSSRGAKHLKEVRGGHAIFLRNVFPLTLH